MEQQRDGHHGAVRGCSPAAMADDLRPARAAGAIPFVGGFETTYIPAHDRDVAETTEHDIRWPADVALLRASGVRRMRYAVRWHRVEMRPGEFDWSETDAHLAHLERIGIRPIVDLVHHTSYPRWLRHGFGDPEFSPAYLRYVEQFARRHPEIEEYTLFNEPYATLFLAGHEGRWPPYHHGADGFVGLLANVLPGVAEASRRYRNLLPHARHVWVDSCEHHTGSGARGNAYAAMANDRRFVVSDLFLGRSRRDDRFSALVARSGGRSLPDLEPGHIDVLGLDYYAHSQWHFTDTGGSYPTPEPLPLHEQVRAYWERYRVPCMLSETNLRGYGTDRATWLRYTLEQCELAVAGGVPMEGYCWFPFVDSTDWDSLLGCCDGHLDPVGVYWLDEHLDRRGSEITRSFVTAARGARAAELPAYPLAEPVASQLRGYRPHMAHWRWESRPDHTPARAGTRARIDSRILHAT